MAMTVADTILGAARGTAAGAIAAANANGALRFGEATAYLNEVFRLAPLVSLDPSIVVSQSAHETDYWRSGWWTERLNPAGIGITGDPAQNAQSHTWANGTDAAQSHLAHLLVYVLGPTKAAAAWAKAAGAAQPLSAVDPRYDAYVEAYGDTAIARTIHDLAGTWAVDPAYDVGIVAKSRVLFPQLPDQGASPVADVTFGNVPHPAVDIRDIPNNTAWNNLGQRTIRSICWHRMLGTLWGTDSWFRGGGASSALTDYGLGVAASDGAGEAGHLMRWNDPRGRRAPWANGPVSGAYGDGKAFVDTYGVNGVNRDVVSLEISGQQTTPLDEKARAKICELTAYWADQYRVPWAAFPAIEAEGGRSFVIWHQEFTIGTGKECPFQVVMDETTGLIARTKDILKSYQTAGKPPVTPSTTTTAPPTPLPEFPAARVKAPDTILAQGFKLELCPNPRWTATHGGRFKTYPDRAAPNVVAPYKAGDGKTYTLPYQTTVKREVWLVSSNGSWAMRKNFAEAAEG